MSERDFYYSEKSFPNRHWTAPSITRLLHTPGEPLPTAPPHMPRPLLLTPRRKRCPPAQGKDSSGPQALQTRPRNKPGVWEGEGKREKGHSIKG